MSPSPRITFTGRNEMRVRYRTSRSRWKRRKKTRRSASICFDFDKRSARKMTMACGYIDGIQFNSTFNTVRSRFSVFTICVMHASGYLQRAWFITSDRCTETIAYCLRTPLRSPSQTTKVFWCQWHVLKAMRENVLSKLPRGETRRKCRRICTPW